MADHTAADGPIVAADLTAAEGPIVAEGPTVAVDRTVVAVQAAVDHAVAMAVDKRR